MKSFKIKNLTIQNEKTQNMAKQFAKSFAAAMVVIISALTLNVQAQEVSNLDELLNQLAQGQVAQTAENKRREAQFNSRKSEQVQMLADAVNKREEKIVLSTKLEAHFQQNEIDLANRQDALNRRLGELKELFGVLQQVAGDTKSKFQNSVISAQISGREAFLDEFSQSMGSSSKLASIEEIEKIWFELQLEMTESAKITRFNREVVLADGKKVQAEVTRVGNFNLVANGKYLEFISETGSVAELIRQPSGRYLGTANSVTRAAKTTNSEQVAFALDPTGGSILSLLVQAPDTQERVDQGGPVGYVILAIGLVGLLIAIERFIALFFVGNKVNRQLRAASPSNDNTLGRVLMVKEKHANVDIDTLELKLSERILKEVPALTSRLTIIKIISVVAPLIGLLGTVTGMINTFQAITLFGTGDPKLMAGGISQALVTTVLGLVVAIPMVFIFTLLNTRSRGIINILQQQSAGIVAERAESSLQANQGA